MKKLLIIGGIIALLLVAFEFFGPDYDRSLSDAQRNIRGSLGQPANFVVTYIARGAGSGELVRYETWFYPNHARSITFYAGDIVATDEMPFEAPGETVYSVLRPEDLDLKTTYDDIKGLVGGATVQRVDFLPELFLEGDVETYMTDHLIFTLEGGSLVYAQTVGTTK
jgi:hypothetical protein